jgi:hypothetical protein
LIGWLWVQGLAAPMHLGLYWQALCVPLHFKGALLLYQSSRWPPDLYSWCPLTSRRSPDTYAWANPRLHIDKGCGQRFHALLHTFYTMGCLSAPIKCRCVLRLLCPVRRPVTTLDCILLKDRSLALVPGQGPEINSQACLRLLPRLRHCPHCWFVNQWIILFFRSCLETPKAGSGPTNFWDRATPCKLISNFVTSHSSMSWDPV